VPSTIRTQVAIIGGGPSGLMLSHLLHLEGIESIVLERRSEDYVIQRVRAGVLEQGTVDLMHATGLGERLAREGLRHDGIELRFDGESHQVPITELTGGRGVTIYGQQEVVKDLIAARRGAAGRMHFEVPDARINDIRDPRVSCSIGGEQIMIEADYLAGCDGFHGISREAIPTEHRVVFERGYPFGWVGILVAVAPSTELVTYAWHERGFALSSMRSPDIARLYVQCPRDDDMTMWPERRIWDELHTRLGVPGWSLREGRILESGITGMRSFVLEPMQYQRLFLAGDAAHIVPPTGAKGLNLAMADVQALAERFASRYRTGSTTGLDSYSATRLANVWKAQDFSNWMTTMLHRSHDDHGGFDSRLQLARLRGLVGSRGAMAFLAENYAG
jgi:p-hydroxybenzoate 3-monooxygenase